MKRAKSAVALLIAMNVISMSASENKFSGQKVENKRKFVPQLELLIYPEDAHMEVDEKNLPQGVKKMIGDNTFIVPVGFDATLIDKNLVPKRILDAPFVVDVISVTK